MLPRLRETLDAGTKALEDVRGLAGDLRGEDGMLASVARPWREAGEVLAAALGESDLPSTLRLMRELTQEMSYASGEFALLVASARRDLDLFRDTLESVRRLADVLERDPAALLHGRAHTPLWPDGR